MEKIKLVGWQSWTHCSDKQGLFKRIRNYSPFGGDVREIEIEPKSMTSKPPVGWNSWPQFMYDINEDKILTVANWIKKHKNEIPLEYILIDDGWTRWGDWKTPDTTKFPNGLKQLSAKIIEMGLKPGLWISPFMVDGKSELLKTHPEWLAKNKNGEIIDGKKNYFFDKIIPHKKYLLDLENDQAYSYIIDCFKTIILGWNIKFLKIDFTYAGHFNPVYKTQRKPDNQIKQLFKDIQNIQKDVFILACGCPLFPAVGVVDAMRISDDVILPPLKNVPVLNKIVHSKRLNELKDNFNARKETSKIWFLDPDMFVCHPKFGLSEKQTYEYQKIVMDAKGVIFLGDYLPELTKTS